VWSRELTPRLLQGLTVGNAEVKLGIAGYRTSSTTSYAPHLSSIKWQENYGRDRWELIPSLKITDSGSVGHQQARLETARPLRTAQHGCSLSRDAEALPRAEEAAPDELDPLAELPHHVVPLSEARTGSIRILDLLVDCGSAKSISDARRLVRGGLTTINDRRVDGEDECLTSHCPIRMRLSVRSRGDVAVIIEDDAS
jgi:hypothetical protein